METVTRENLSSSNHGYQFIIKVLDFCLDNLDGDVERCYSIHFIYVCSFLPIVFILYWVLPHKIRWILMLAAGYYVAAILLEKTESLKNRKWIFVGTTVACLVVLFFFKYFNFVSESVTAVFSVRSLTKKY